MNVICNNLQGDSVASSVNPSIMYSWIYRGQQQQQKCMIGVPIED